MSESYTASDVRTLIAELTVQADAAEHWCRCWVSEFNGDRDECARHRAEMTHALAALGAYAERLEKDDTQFGRSDEYWLAMAALDNYPVEDRLPKSTSVVFRIHQLGHARDDAREEGRREILKEIAAFDSPFGVASDSECRFCIGIILNGKFGHYDHCLWLRAVLLDPIETTPHDVRCRVCGNSESSIYRAIVHKPHCPATGKT